MNVGIHTRSGDSGPTAVPPGPVIGAVAPTAGSPGVAQEQSSTNKYEPLGELSTLMKGLPTFIKESCPQGVCKALPAMPGLHVAGVPILLPIVHQSQEVGIGQLGQAHSEAIQSASWAIPVEVDGAKILFTNPAWGEGIRTLAKSLALDFGVPGIELTCKLDKLTLFRPGDHLQPRINHRSSASHIATLFVQLPSACSGGQHIVYQRTAVQPTTMDFQNGTAEALFGCTYAAHVSGLPFGVTPSQAGYRLVAEYEVLLPASQPLPAFEIPALLKEIAKQHLQKLSRVRLTFSVLFRDGYDVTQIINRGRDALSAQDGAILSLLHETGLALGKEGYVLHFLHIKRMPNFSRAGRYSSYFRSAEILHKDEDQVIELYSLDGTRVPVAEQQKHRIDEMLYPNSMINLGTVGLNEPWTASDAPSSATLFSEGSAHMRRCHKLGLVAWPRAQQNSRRLQFIGATAWFQQLVDKDRIPTSTEVSDLLEVWHSPDPWIIHDKAERTACQKLFALLIRMPSLQPLLHQLFKNFTNSKDFVGDVTEAVQPETQLSAHVGVDALLGLMCNDALWMREDIRQQVKHAFRTTSVDAYHVIQLCIKKKMAAWRWRIFEEAVQEALIVSHEPRLGHYWRNSGDAQKWAVAIQLPDPRLCKLLVNVHLRGANVLTDRPAETLSELQRSMPTLFQTKAAILKPLVEWVIQDHSDHLKWITDSANTWAFRQPLTGMPAEFERFLRSDQQQAIYAFRTRSEADRFSRATYINKMEEGYSCNVATVKNYSNKFEVHCTKTDTYRQQQLAKKSGIEASLDLARKLLATIEALPPVSTGAAMATPWAGPELRFYLESEPLALAQVSSARAMPSAQADHQAYPSHVVTLGTSSSPSSVAGTQASRISMPSTRQALLPGFEAAGAAAVQESVPALTAARSSAEVRMATHHTQVSPAAAALGATIAQAPPLQPDALLSTSQPLTHGHSPASTAIVPGPVPRPPLVPMSPNAPSADSPQQPAALVKSEPESSKHSQTLRDRDADESVAAGELPESKRRRL